MVSPSARLMVVAALVLGAPAAPGAQEQLDALVRAINVQGVEARTAAATMDRVARATGSRPDALRTQQAATGLGWGDLLAAHRIAWRSGHPVDRVIAAWRKEPRWTAIADEARVGLDVLASDLLVVFPELAAPAPASPPAAEAGPRSPEPPRGVLERARRSVGDKRAGPEETPTDPAARDAAREIRDRIFRGSPRY
jgi:hypothetical protein